MLPWAFLIIQLPITDGNLTATCTNICDSLKLYKYSTKRRLANYVEPSILKSNEDVCSNKTFVIIIGENCDRYLFKKTKNKVA